MDLRLQLLAGCKFKRSNATKSFIDTQRAGEHSFFASIAELVDNSKDAKAKNVSIDFVVQDGLSTLEILDDGEGMTRSEVASTMNMGYSRKVTEMESQIGRYGHGLKAGGMRLGTELFLLTKKNDTYSMLLLSKKFQDEMSHDQLAVPMPSFTSDFAPLTHNSETHRNEVLVIEKYAPLGRETFKSLFAKIKGPSGTLIIIDQLTRDIDGNFEFSVKDNDMVLENEARDRDKYLRVFLSDLYWNSSMTIRLCGQIVFPIVLPQWWMFPRKNIELNMHFPGQWKKTLEELTLTVDQMNEIRNEMASEIGNMNHMKTGIDKATNKQRNMNAMRFEEAEKELKKARLNLKNSKEYKTSTIKFHFGVNVKNRENCGLYVYINGRRIMAGFKDPVFLKKKHNIGLCAMVHLTYQTLSPSADKQSFENMSDFYILVKTCNKLFTLYSEHLTGRVIPQHLKTQFDVKIENVLDVDKVFTEFWKAYGYKDPFLPECVQETITKKRLISILTECKYWRQCQKCHHFRSIWNAITEPPLMFHCPGGRCPQYSDTIRWMTLEEPKNRTKARQGGLESIAEALRQQAELFANCAANKPYAEKEKKKEEEKEKEKAKDKDSKDAQVQKPSTSGTATKPSSSNSSAPKNISKPTLVPTNANRRPLPNPTAIKTSTSAPSTSSSQSARQTATTSQTSQRNVPSPSSSPVPSLSRPSTSRAPQKVYRESSASNDEGMEHDRDDEPIPPPPKKPKTTSTLVSMGATRTRPQADKNSRPAKIAVKTATPSTSTSRSTGSIATPKFFDSLRRNPSPAPSQPCSSSSRAPRKAYRESSTSEDEMMEVDSEDAAPPPKTMKNRTTGVLTSSSTSSTSKSRGGPTGIRSSRQDPSSTGTARRTSPVARSSQQNPSSTRTARRSSPIARSSRQDHSSTSTARRRSPVAKNSGQNASSSRTAHQKSTVARGSQPGTSSTRTARLSSPVASSSHYNLPSTSTARQRISGAGSSRQAPTYSGTATAASMTSKNAGSFATSSSTVRQTPSGIKTSRQTSTRHEAAARGTSSTTRSYRSTNDLPGTSSSWSRSRQRTAGNLPSTSTASAFEDVDEDEPSVEQIRRIRVETAIDKLLKYLSLHNTGFTVDMKLPTTAQRLKHVADQIRAFDHEEEED